MDLPKLEIRKTGPHPTRDVSVKLNGIELTDLALQNITVEMGDKDLPTLTAHFILGEVKMDAEVALNLVASLIDKELLTITEPPEDDEPPYEVDEEGRSLSS